MGCRIMVFFIGNFFEEYPIIPSTMAISSIQVFGRAQFVATLTASGYERDRLGALFNNKGDVTRKRFKTQFGDEAAKYFSEIFVYPARISGSNFAINRGADHTTAIAVFKEKVPLAPKAYSSRSHHRRTARKTREMVRTPPKLPDYEAIDKYIADNPLSKTTISVGESFNWRGVETKVPNNLSTKIHTVIASDWQGALGFSPHTPRQVIERLLQAKTSSFPPFRFERGDTIIDVLKLSLGLRLDSGGVKAYTRHSIESIHTGRRLTSAETFWRFWLPSPSLHSLSLHSFEDGWIKLGSSKSEKFPAVSLYLRALSTGGTLVRLELDGKFTPPNPERFLKPILDTIR